MTDTTTEVVEDIPAADDHAAIEPAPTAAAAPPWPCASATATPSPST